MIRNEFLIGAAVALFNIALFGIASPYFINEIHHHWIVPTFCAWLLVQAIAVARLSPAWGKPVYVVIFALALLTGIILFWRQFSMFQCFRHCEGRLAAGLVALAATFMIAWHSVSFRHHRFVLWMVWLFAVWAVIIVIAGFARGAH